MKKLFLAISFATISFFATAQTDTSHINLNLTFKDIQNIVNGLQELKIKDALNTYLAVTNQTQTQIFKHQEAIILKQDSITKKKPIVKN